jgi:hypothetical protein
MDLVFFVSPAVVVSSYSDKRPFDWVPVRTRYVSDELAFFFAAFAASGMARHKMTARMRRR